MRGFDSCYPCLTNQPFSKKSYLFLSKNLHNVLPKLALPQRLRLGAAIFLPNAIPSGGLTSNGAPLFGRSSSYMPSKYSSTLNVSNKKRRLANKLALTKVFNFKSGLVFNNLIPASVPAAGTRLEARSSASCYTGAATNANQLL